MLAIEECGVANGTDPHAAALVGDLGAQLGPLVAIGAEKTQLHQLMGAKELLQLGEEFGRESAASNLETGLERLAEAAQV